jgi:hypothetical protein
MTLKLLLSEDDIINAISDMRAEGIIKLCDADGEYNFYINLPVDRKINTDETKNAIGRKFTDLAEVRIVCPSGYAHAKIILRFYKKGIA